MSESNKLEGWAVADTADGDYEGPYETRNKAIQRGIEQYDDEFWIGEVDRPMPPEDFWNARDWIEKIREDDDYEVDAAADWGDDITDRHMYTLESEVRKVLGRWLDRHNFRPKHFVVKEPVRVKVKYRKIQYPSENTIKRVLAEVRGGALTDGPVWVNEFVYRLIDNLPPDYEIIDE